MEMTETGERISIFDILKIGIGPSSSHTMGPWRAALSFLKDNKKNKDQITSLKINLFGSLAKTGKGHGTDMAVILGLSGAKIDTISADKVQQILQDVRSTKKIKLDQKVAVNFDPATDIIFHKEIFLTFHPNGISFEALLGSGEIIQSTYYSIGGGFIVKSEYPLIRKKKINFPYPIDRAEDILKWHKKTGLSIADIVYQNELSLLPGEKINQGLHKIWKVMLESVYRGCHTEGLLPGGLQVKRRSNAISGRLLPEDRSNAAEEWIENIRSKTYSFSEILKWVSCFAMAVNEENASFGRIVTAPTNGAAGVIPAVLMYMICFTDLRSSAYIDRFLMVAAETGSVFKKGSTISAAMGGCQAEIGVSSAMAASALTECLGGGPEKVLMAAEIAMEHHLGLTCDPVAGLVQVPCIERNSMGAIKAITASQLALESDPTTAKVTLDEVIKTMWDTAQDMNSKYKETSDGGLAINIPVNIPDC